MIGKKSFGKDKDHQMFYVYLGEDKKQLTDQVVKSVQFTVGKEKTNVLKHPFILTRVSKVPLEAEVVIKFKPWTSRNAMLVNPVKEE